MHPGQEIEHEGFREALGIVQALKERNWQAIGGVLYADKVPESWVD
jgi:hypothetical protein